MVEEHGSSMSSKDRKDIRRVTADFDLERTSDPRRQRQDGGINNGVSRSAPQGLGANGARRRREGFGSTITDSNETTDEAVSHNEQISSSSLDASTQSVTSTNC